MSAPALPAADARGAVRRNPAPSPRKLKVAHPKAIAIFIVPFAILFTLFYLVPIGYAVYQSLLVVERDGTFGKATEVFGGLTQYILVFQNGPFWNTATYWVKPPKTSRAAPKVPSRSITSSDW